MSAQYGPRELVEAVTFSAGYTKAVGTRVLAVTAGRVELSLDQRPDLLQANGHFHGGVIAALADHAAGGALTTASPPGRFAVTIDLHVNYLAPATGECLIARARSVRAGSTIGVAHVEVVSRTGANEHLCAIATVTLRIVELPPHIRGPVP